MKSTDPIPYGTSAGITENFSANDDWRFEQPEWNYDKCIRCGSCYLACPDGALTENSEGYYEADLRYCKGCGICVRQCWTGCITLTPTAQRPPWLIK